MIWTRVLHLFKCFTHTAHIMRMATEILYRIRWLIAFIVISLLSFGLTYFFVSSNTKEPFDGIIEMFNVLVGKYSSSEFSNTYEAVLLVLSSSFNAFFIFTLLVALSVISFSKGDRGVWSNEAYHDKASLMGLYSYLLDEKAVRAPSDQYLLVAKVTDQRKGRSKRNSQQGGTQLAGAHNSPQDLQVRNMKTIELKLSTLQKKLD